MSRTKSESLFEEYCRRNGLDLRRVPESANVKTPDYELVFETTKIIVEVKELARNMEERESDRLLDERGYGSVIRRMPGERVRKKIGASSAQIKTRTQHRFPGLLVLYGSGPLSLDLDSYQIRAAMCGLEQIMLAIPVDPSISPFSIGTRFGAKRQMTPDANTSISGIGVMTDDRTGQISFSVYHNRYAAIPIDPMLLNQYNLTQYRLGTELENKIPQWEELGFYS